MLFLFNFGRIVNRMNNRKGTNAKVQNPRPLKFWSPLATPNNIIAIHEILKHKSYHQPWLDWPFSRGFIKNEALSLIVNTARLRLVGCVTINLTPAVTYHLQLAWQTRDIRLLLEDQTSQTSASQCLLHLFILVQEMSTLMARILQRKRDLPHHSPLPKEVQARTRFLRAPTTYQTCLRMLWS